MKKWFYLSFAAGAKWLGATYVEGVDVADAISNAWMRHLNPGGSVAAVEIAAHIPVPDSLRYRLITDLAELERLAGPTRRLQTD